MTQETLLRELETLSHGARLQRMAELGRQSRTDASLRTVLATLAQAEEVYARTLALASCWGSEDASLAEGARTDPSRTVRHLANAVLVRFGTSRAVLALLAELPHRKARRQLLQALAKARRTDILDAALAQLQEDDDPDIVRFLAYGSESTVRAGLEQAGDRLEVTDLKALAKRHPAPLAEYLHHRLSTTPQRDPRLLHLCHRVLHFFAEDHPERALALIAALRERYSLAEIALPDALLQRRPEAVIDLILSTDEPLWMSVTTAAKVLDTERLVALARQHPSRDHLKQAWPELSPEQRRALWEVCGTGWQQKNGALPLAITQKLPDAALRYAEARRCWALPALATRPQERLPYAGLLPWDEALVVVEPYLKNPDAELRALALRALCTVAGYHADSLPALLALLKAREFEQDPVRLAFLEGLAELPPGRWQEEHLPDLTTLFRHARAAADLSPTSGGYAVALVGALLKRFPAWAGPELATWVKVRGDFDLSVFRSGLSQSEVAALEPHLLPILRSWKTRERESYLLSAATALGKHLAVLPGLVAILEQVIRDTAHNRIAARALGLLREHQRERFVALVPELLAKDPSWIRQPVVWEYLHRQRQDLLTEDFLGRRALVGRFSTGHTRFVLPIAAHFYRWTPHQQQVFARSLSELLADSERANYESFQAVRQYQALLDVPWRPLLHLARQAARNPALRDMALRALGRLDAGQGLEILLESLSDDRMRVAIYALRAQVLELPLSRALAVLREAPRRRLTVAKEVVRLLGELPRGAGLEDLFTLEQEPELHRDLRVALLRALWDHREREVVWPIWERALDSGEAPLAAVILRAPVSGLSARALGRQLQLIARAIAHPDPALRLAALEAARAVPNTDNLLTEPVLVSLTAALPDERRAAVQVLTHLCADTPALAGEAVRRTLPHRRALLEVVAGLISVVSQGHTRFEGITKATLTALEEDPLLLVLQARVGLTALSELDLIAWLPQKSWTEESLMVAVETLEQRASLQPLPALEEVLWAGTGPQRRLGLAALIGRAKCVEGWSGTIRIRLQTLCQDPDPLVAAAAQFTFPPETTTTSPSLSSA